MKRTSILALALCLTLIPAAAWGTSPPPSASRETAVVISLSGTVDDFNRDALQRRFEKARRLGAGTVILEIDTYGGLVSSALDISRYIKNQPDLHTIAFVNSKAISAGAMIALACDEIVMTPSATLGDCAPIQADPAGGMRTLGDTERAKAESPVLADFEESAKRNGYDALIARAMVTVKPAVYYIQSDTTGKKRFVDAEEYQQLTAPGQDESWKPVPDVKNPVDAADTLLTVGTDTATRIGLAKGTATSAQDLASQRGLSIVETLSSGAGDKAVALFSHPIARLILLTIFLQSLFIAIKLPGHGAPEAICLLSLGLLVGIPLLTGYAQWWHLVLVFGGLALVAFEIFVFPGHLVSLIIGGVMVLAGLVLTFVGDAWQVPGSWSIPATRSALERGIFIVVGGLACSMLLSMWLRRYLPSLPYFHRLILATPGAAAETVSAEGVPAMDEADVWPFAGTVGRAVTDLRPGGSAQFPYADDTRVTGVISDSGYVRAGTKLLVKEARSNRVVVRAVTNKEEG